MPNLLVRRTTDGQVATTPSTVASVVLTAGSDAATVDVCNGTDNSTPLLSLKAATATTVTHTFRGGGVFPAGVYVDLTGTGPSVTVELED